MKQAIKTTAAPQPIGPYSQAIKIGNIVYLSGQIPKSPQTEQMIINDFTAEVKQVFENLSAVCQASGGEMRQIVKLSIFLTDLSNFSTVNEVMLQYFQQPYPARSTIQVSALPASARVEIEAVLVLV